jgi:hypothetical protein
MILLQRSSGGPLALPSLYRRTAGPEFDKSPKKFCFFRALERWFAPDRLNIRQNPHRLLTSLFVLTAESALAGIPL